MLCLYMLFAGQLRREHEIAVEAGRMKNVTVEVKVPAQSSVSSEKPEPASADLPPAETTELPVIAPVPEETAEALPEPFPLEEDGRIRETTIEGGLTIRNHTGFETDLAEMLAEGPPLRLPADGPQILIIHTHSSEAYTPAGLDRYEASDSNRTEDERFNIIRVGDELCGIYEEAGLQVIHDRGVYDYPSYTGSYGRSGAAIEAYLAEHPDIAVVIDMHRDALGSEGVVYKIMAEEEGVVASQMMLLVGTNESGLEHPNWRSNLSLALYLQNAVNQKYPSLMRPVDLVPQRYNQHLSGGSLILEVGSSGNTLQEALAAMRLFAADTAPALLALVEGAEMNEG